MHLYSIDELDYQQMAKVVLPYLNKNKIAHKTLSSTMSPGLLAKTAPEQTGKAFTIYPQSQEEMARIAKDLDKLIREHNLTTNTSHITGDNQLGNSGRLFYRYEFPTGKLKDKIYAPGERAPYDANRGEGQYLAYDMTPADDPWLNFDPSNPNAVPGQRVSTESPLVQTKSVKISTEIRQTFSENTHKKLTASLTQNGATATLEKGNTRYTVQNKDGVLVITAKETIKPTGRIK